MRNLDVFRRLSGNTTLYHGCRRNRCVLVQAAVPKAPAQSSQKSSAPVTGCHPSAGSAGVLRHKEACRGHVNFSAWSCLGHMHVFMIM